MQLSIWIIAVAVVVGPVLLGLLLHRLGFSRAVALGTGMAFLGGAFLISGDPHVGSSVGERTVDASPAMIAVPANQSVDPAVSEELAALRSKVAALEQEKATHEEARRARDAANAPHAEATEQPTVRDQTNDAELRLAIANAEIERLKAALRAAEPIPTATPLPTTPEPFAHAPEAGTVQDAAPEENAAKLATGATDRDAASESPNAAIGHVLAEAMRSRDMAVVKLANDELVQGRRGSYYRITCPGNDNRPLRFGSGDYTFDAAGYDQLDRCWTAVRTHLLDALPANATHRLYVQGYASLRGFIRPKRLPARDKHLRSFDYLPRMKDLDRFSTAKARQTTGKRFTNDELPNLRAASIAHWIDEATKGSVSPEILEGAFEPGSHATSQSFALLFHVAW